MVMRHRQLMAGSSNYGGVCECVWDDHTGESSTCVQPVQGGRWWNAYMPRCPALAGVQEILDLRSLGNGR